jgi:hypothetical protein
VMASESPTPPPEFLKIPLLNFWKRKGPRKRAFFSMIHLVLNALFHAGLWVELFVVQ